MTGQVRHPLDDRGVVWEDGGAVERAVSRQRAIERGEWASIVELLPELLRKQVVRALDQEREAA